MVSFEMVVFIVVPILIFGALVIYLSSKNATLKKIIFRSCLVFMYVLLMFFVNSDPGSSRDLLIIMGIGFGLIIFPLFKRTKYCIQCGKTAFHPIYRKIRKNCPSCNGNLI